MVYDAEDTRRRIFEAAADEFAAHGLAGARVDRIATTAKANKQAIYLYFGGKEKLFASIVRAKMEEVSEAICFDPAAIASSVGALFDWYQEHPELIRLLLWEALETDSPAPDGEARRVALDGDTHRRTAFQTKVRGVAEAACDPRDKDCVRAAQDLVFTIMGLIAWNFAVPRLCRQMLDEETDEAALARRRETVIDTARDLIARAGFAV